MPDSFDEMRDDVLLDDTLLDAFLDEAFAALPVQVMPEPPERLRDNLRRLAAIGAAPARRVTTLTERRGNEYRIVRHEESEDLFALFPVATPSVSGSGANYQRYYYREEKR